MRPLLAAALLAAFASAAPVPKALMKQTDKELVAGTWKPAEGRTEWFEFTADGGMKARTNGNSNSPVAYTYAVEPDPDGREWRMVWSSKGQPKPSYQAVFVVDGDRLHMSYSGSTSTPMAKPEPSSLPTFTRQTP